VPTQEPIATTVRVDQSLLTKCPEQLPTAKSGSLAALLSNHVAGARMYHLCMQNNNALVMAVQGQQGINGQ
jgi:hypothetical protein